MPNAVSNYEDGRRKNRRGADLYEQTKHAIAEAGRIDPSRDASAENARRVRANPNGPWTAGTQDDRSASASSKPKRRL
jgi:hypothetical protein